MRKAFEFYTDPGHGWLKVKQKELMELNIEDKISSFSYKRNDDVFLEEDSDASLFINAFEKVYGRRPNIKGHISNKQSKIRGYESYKNINNIKEKYFCILELYKDKTKNHGVGLTKIDYDAKDGKGNSWLSGAVGNIIIRAKYQKVLKKIYLLTKKEYADLYNYAQDGETIINFQDKVINRLKKCKQYDCENANDEQIYKIHSDIKKELEID